MSDEPFCWACFGFALRVHSSACNRLIVMRFLPAPLQLSAARDPPDLPTDTLRLFVGGRELSTDSALVSEVGLGNGHVMHAQASHRCEGQGQGSGLRVLTLGSC